jgi:hypothetical protein
MMVMVVFVFVEDDLGNLLWVSPGRVTIPGTDSACPYLALSTIRQWHLPYLAFYQVYPAFRLSSPV